MEVINDLVSVVYENYLSEVMLLCLKVGDCIKDRLTSHARRKAPVYTGNCDCCQLALGGDVERLGHCCEEKIVLPLTTSLPRAHDSVDDA